MHSAVVLLIVIVIVQVQVNYIRLIARLVLLVYSERSKAFAIVLGAAAIFMLRPRGIN